MDFSQISQMNMSRGSVNEPVGNNNGFLLANKLARQLQHRSVAVDVDNHPALDAVQKKFRTRKRSSDDLVLRQAAATFTFGLNADSGTISPRFGNFGQANNAAPDVQRDVRQN